VEFKRASQVMNIFTHAFVQIIYHFQKIIMQFVLLGPHREPADHWIYLTHLRGMRKAVVFVVYLCTGSAAFMAPVLPGLPGLRRANSMQVCYPSHNSCQRTQTDKHLACLYRFGHHISTYVRLQAYVYEHLCVCTYMRPCIDSSIDTNT